MHRLYAALPDRVAVVEVSADADANANANGDAETGAPVVRETAPHPDASLQCVAVSPADPDRVCCGTADHGLFRSTNAGATWTRVDGIGPDHVTSVACAAVDHTADADADSDGSDGGAGEDRGEDAHDGDRVDWWVGTEPSRVYHSHDARIWTERPGLTDLPSSSSWAFPPRPHTHHVRWIEVDPHSKALYVAVEAGALVRTDDGGETWTDRVPDSRRDTHSMATHPDAPGRAYCAAGDGYAETRDGGETWTRVEEGLDHRYCWSVAVDPADPDHRILSAARGARTAHSAESADTYVYEKRGEEPWERVDGLPTGEGVTRYVLGVGDAGFYALSNAGLFRSPDGEEWNRLPLSVSEDATVAGVAVGRLD